jgi:hypothetical protein
MQNRAALNFGQISTLNIFFWGVVGTARTSTVAFRSVSSHSLAADPARDWCKKRFSLKEAASLAK